MTDAEQIRHPELNEYLLRRQISEIATQASFSLLALDTAEAEIQFANDKNKEKLEIEDLLREQLKKGEISWPEYADAFGSAPFYVHTSPLPVFLSLLGFLSHAAMVSKFLWPATVGVSSHGRRFVGAKNVDRLKQIREERGKRLRTALGITGDWAIQSRDLRDHMEHYDERLEEWWIASENHNMVDLSLMSRTAVGGLAENDFHRMYDPGTGIFVFRNEDFEVHAMAREIQTIRTSAIAWLENHGEEGAVSILSR